MGTHLPTNLSTTNLLTMEKAKQAVANFVSRDGKHTTTVDEDVRKAVTEEHIRPHEHEDVVTAIDKEIHQDHHHTTVQPITMKETLPEKHTHHAIPVEHKSYEHGNERDVNAFLERDASKYRNSSVTHETTHSSSTAPVVSGEHTHHHVHEHVQPVIQKETLERHVVHTTIPVHEIHHAAAVQHGTSTLPPKTLEEFTSGRGTLEGRATTKVNEFEGCPNISHKDLHAKEAKSAAQAQGLGNHV